MMTIPVERLRNCAKDYRQMAEKRRSIADRPIDATERLAMISHASFLDEVADELERVQREASYSSIIRTIPIG